MIGSSAAAARWTTRELRNAAGFRLEVRDQSGVLLRCV